MNKPKELPKFDWNKLPSEDRMLQEDWPKRTPDTEEFFKANRPQDKTVHGSNGMTMWLASLKKYEPLKSLPAQKYRKIMRRARDENLLPSDERMLQMAQMEKDQIGLVDEPSSD